jgi:cell division septation protein DedD
MSHSRFLVSLASALFALPLAAQAQTDPRLVDIIHEAQQGQGDSARIQVQRLLASTPPADTLYPQILYTQAMVATDAGSMRRQLQRVAVEHATSSWADDALLRLVQLDYASGNLDGAARNLERLRRDYPGSTLLPQTSYWAARTYFDQKNPQMACRWLADGLAASRDNIELENQLGYLNQRCSTVAIDSTPQPPADTMTSVSAAAVDTTAVARPPDSTPAPRNPNPAPPQPAAAAAPFRIQITAVRTASAAQTMVAKLKARGFAAVTAEEGGLYKVRVGRYPSRADAVAALPGVKAKLGGSPFVVAGP